jgi:short-chain fatty acids transporter
MLASYLNWAFSLIFAAILAREVARNVPKADYRALGAMAFLGLGTVWAQGLSGSAALQVASASSSPAPVQEVIKAFTMFIACFPAALLAVTLLAPHVTW